jgi:hypothetical protein
MKLTEFTGTTGPNEASPLTTATSVDGGNHETWLQPLLDRTNAVKGRNLLALKQKPLGLKRRWRHELVDYAHAAHPSGHR